MHGESVLFVAASASSTTTEFALSFESTALGTGRIVEYCDDEGASFTLALQELKTVGALVPILRGNLYPTTLTLTYIAVTLKRTVIDPIIQRSIDACPTHVTFMT